MDRIEMEMDYRENPIHSQKYDQPLSAPSYPLPNSPSSANASNANSPGPGATGGGGTGSSSDPKSDWRVNVDEDTNRRYYFNTVTNKSQWDRPKVLGPDEELHALCGSRVENKPNNPYSDYFPCRCPTFSEHFKYRHLLASLFYYRIEDASHHCPVKGWGARFRLVLFNIFSTLAYGTYTLAYSNPATPLSSNGILTFNFQDLLKVSFISTGFKTVIGSILSIFTIQLLKRRPEDNIQEIKCGCCLFDCICSIISCFLQLIVGWGRYILILALVALYMAMLVLGIQSLQNNSSPSSTAGNIIFVFLLSYIQDQVIIDPLFTYLGWLRLKRGRSLCLGEEAPLQNHKPRGYCCGLIVY